DRLKKDSPIDEITITCPYCGSTNLKKSGFYRGNKQRYICKKCFKSIMYPTYPKDTELCPYCKDGSIRKDGVSTIGGKQRQRKFCNVCYGTFYVPLETVDNDIEEQQLSDENDNTSTENKEKMKQFGGVRIPELSDVSIIAMKSEGGMKQCSKCKQWKNKTEFSKQRDKKDGVRSYCRECDKNYQKQYKEKMLGKEGENNNDEEV
ncbi:hypothetical protein KKH23_09080, partial [Patescibacteria group bacterium]|nr:hypothetical protein [Patescibacteria group bacterium]